MRRLTAESGNVIIVTALLMTTLFGFLALVVDIGASLVRRSSLQTGADAAALAIAKQCAEAVVTGSTTCTTSIAQSYFDDNMLGGSPVQLDAPVLQTSYDGKVGRITVNGTFQQQPYFAGVLGHGGAQTVRANATARWGPLTAEDAVFPIAICKGPLPPVDQSVTLVIDPASATDPNQCDGSPTEQPFGWIPPDNTAECASKITLLPSTYLNVGPVDTPPGGTECDARLDELVNDIESGPPQDRQRVLVVYDAAAGGSPSYALIALEFTGMRVAGREAHRGSTEACPTGQYCIRGVVRLAETPTDGPIVDPTLAALPGIEDSTVLDVRLVD